MSDAITRLNAALEGRYAIERELAHLAQRGAAPANGPLSPHPYGSSRSTCAPRFRWIGWSLCRRQQPMHLSDPCLV